MMAQSDVEPADAVADLIARRDISDCIYRYMRGQDRIDAPLQRSAFHDGAYVDCGAFSGDGDAWVEYAQTGLRGCAFTHHMIGQVHLDIRGDAASGEVYFIAYHRMSVGGDEKDMIFGGRYIDEYARRDGVWGIVKRYEVADWTRTVPASDGFLKDIAPDYHRGGRSGADFSELRNWPA